MEIELTATTPHLLSIKGDLVKNT